MALIDEKRPLSSFASPSIHSTTAHACQSRRNGIGSPPSIEFTVDFRSAAYFLLSLIPRTNCSHSVWS
jgi:hypothetical protein